jgi:solute carrier family 26 (sodium-independent sulfate anion transporter), member 11
VVLVQSKPKMNIHTNIDVTWLVGDFIAGITVGMVLVPQGMSYAVVTILILPSFKSRP